MVKWEYLTVKLQGVEQKGTFIAKKFWTEESITQQLNSYGEQGWELVSFTATIKNHGDSSVTDEIFATFKRQKEA